MAVDVVTETVIQRRPAEVAAFAADPSIAPRWHQNIAAVRWETEPPLRIGSKEHGFGAWTLRDPRTGAFVGRGGLKRLDLDGRPEVEILYASLPEYWGRGLATELSMAAVRLGLGELRLPSVIGFTLAGNVGSRRVLEKSGLTYERAFEHAGLPHVLYRIRADG